MLWPLSAERDNAGALMIGGVSVPGLVAEHGTPLYIYDEATIRRQCAVYRDAFQEHYPNSRIVYAGKAYLSSALLHVIADEGLSADAVSAGEMYFAWASGFPMERLTFHGNNKTEDELRLAIDLGVGEVVIDNHYEIELLERVLEEKRATIRALIRLNPGIDTHTHDYRKTGIVDSKFGLLIKSGDAAKAVERVGQIPAIDLRGYHVHLGSQIFETEPFVAGVDALFVFAAEMRERFGVIPSEISPGGGFGIQYETGDPEVDVDRFATAVATATREGAEKYGFENPLLIIEPGRSIVGPAGVAVYRAGAVKEIPGVRTYVSVDGGMADNIRPPLYGAKYEATLANRLSDERSIVTIAGKYCESGDVLITDAEMTMPQPGDLVAIAAAGAYCLAMASNYNMALKPAVMMVNEGESRVIQRRERLEDLLAREMMNAGIEERVALSVKS